MCGDSLNTRKAASGAPVKSAFFFRRSAVEAVHRLVGISRRYQLGAGVSRFNTVSDRRTLLLGQPSEHPVDHFAAFGRRAHSYFDAREILCPQSRITL